VIGVGQQYIHIRSHTLLIPDVERHFQDLDVCLSCTAELLQDGKMSRAADVYSFSMIMWELFACKRLYEGHIASQVLSNLLPFEITHHEQHVWHMCLQRNLCEALIDVGRCEGFVAE